MHRASTPVRIVALIVSCVLFVIAGGSALAVADDYVSHEILPQGVSVAGVDVSGLTRAEARAVIDHTVAAKLSEPVTLSDSQHVYTLDAGRFITVDVAGMVDEAFTPRASTTLPYRVAERAMRAPSGVNAGVELAIDEVALAEWIAAVASEVDTSPADAGFAFKGNSLEMTASRRGAMLDRDATMRNLTAALTAGEKRAELAVVYTEPAVTEDQLGAAIVIDKSERRMRFYDKGVLVKTYVVTIGRPAYPTPVGSFHITLKRYMPSWGNPGSAWARNMPQYIPPGRGNPLGTRAMNLDIPGIRIHGTWNDPYIGTATSHGCIRMHRADIEELFDRVKVGDSVFIVN